MDLKQNLSLYVMHFSKHRENKKKKIDGNLIKGEGGT